MYTVRTSVSISFITRCLQASSITRSSLRTNTMLFCEMRDFFLSSAMLQHPYVSQHNWSNIWCEHDHLLQIQLIVIQNCFMAVKNWQTITYCQLYNSSKDRLITLSFGGTMLDVQNQHFTDRNLGTFICNQCVMWGFAELTHHVLHNNMINALKCIVFAAPTF